MRCGSMNLLQKKWMGFVWADRVLWIRFVHKFWVGLKWKSGKHGVKCYKKA